MAISNSAQVLSARQVPASDRQRIRKAKRKARQRRLAAARLFRALESWEQCEEPSRADFDSLEVVIVPRF